MVSSLSPLVPAEDAEADEAAALPEGLGGKMDDLPLPLPPLKAAILSAMLETPPLLGRPFERDTHSSVDQTSFWHSDR